MAALRWAQSGYLFFLGSAAFGAASIGYLARKRRWHGWLSMHIIGMSLSYIILLTGFYIDNGPKLPLWDRLPTLAFWIGPAAIGLPLVTRTLWQRRRSARDLRAHHGSAASYPRSMQSRISSRT
jgi:hypothetical protein